MTLATYASPRRLIGTGLAVVFLTVFIQGWHFPHDAGLFPRIVGGAGLLLALALLGPERQDDEAGHDDAIPPAASRRHLALALLSAPCFAALVWLAGFYPAAFLALLLLPYLLGYRRKLVLLAIAVGGVLVVYAVFSWMMDTALPNGLLGDWVLTRFIYES